MQVGQPVAAIGSPFGLPETLTSGIISALNRTISAPNNYSISGAIQTDAPINHGNSGGPLLNSSGQVIGVNAQIESDSGGNDGVGFAIPSDAVKSVADTIIAGGKVKHAYLGITIGTSASGGAQVSAVKADSPAATAGLKAGDVITAIDGDAVAIRRRPHGEGQRPSAGRQGDAHRHAQRLDAEARRDARHAPFVAEPPLLPAGRAFSRPAGEPSAGSAARPSPRAPSRA